MSTLKLKGSTSGYVELTAPSTAGDNTITLPTTAGTAVIRDASNNTEVGTGVVIGSPTSNTFTVTTNSTERLRITSAGLMGLGTSSPSSILDVYSISSIVKNQDVAANAANPGIQVQHGGTINGSWRHDGRLEIGGQDANAKIRLNPDGTLGIGTTTVEAPLHVAAANGAPLIKGVASTGTNACYMQVENTAGGFIVGRDNSSGGILGGGAYASHLYSQGAYPLVFSTNSIQRAQIDSSGRLLVGTSSARGNFFNSTFSSALQVEGTNFVGSTISAVCNSTTANFPIFVFGKSNGASIGSNTVVSSGDVLGLLVFQGSDGAEFVEAATVKAEVDGTPGTNDMPGRLVFSVTSDGASSPSEALRISNDRSIAVTQAPGKYTISTSENSTSVANSGTIDFSNFTGMIMITDHFSGQTQVWITGGGNVASLGTAGGTVGSVAYNGGVNGYRWTNNTGGTRTFGFFCVRTRQNG